MARAKSTGNATRIARDVISAAIVSHNDDIARAKRCIAKLRKARYEILQPVLTRIALIVEAIPEDNWAIRVSSYGFEHSKPEISVSLLRQPSLKSDVVCELLAYASDVCPRASSNDYVGEHWGERVHSFRGDALTIRVSIDVAEEGTCRKVMTGTKMVEQKQYEFVCD